MKSVQPGTVIAEELGLRYVMQHGLEQEQTDFFGRGHYERADEQHRGHRNGYVEANVKTAEGGVGVRVPQVRGSAEPFRPKLLDFLDGNSAALERLVCGM